MKKLIYPTKQDGYVVFDFETDGLNPEENGIIQYAIKVVGRESEHIYSSFVYREGMKLSEDIIRITGITEDILKRNGKPEENVVQEIASYMSGWPLIGHNVINFDYKFLTKLFDKYKINTPSTDKLIDTAMICKGIFANDPQTWNQSHYEYAKYIGDLRIKGLKFNLKFCCDEFKIDVSDINWHRADADVEATDRLYKFLLQYE